MDNLQSGFNKAFDDLGLVSQNNPTPADFDKQLKKTLKATFPAPAWKKQQGLTAAAQPGTAPGGMAAREAGCPMLDTPTPKGEHVVSSVSPRKRAHRTFSKMHRRMYSRVLLGLRLPGRYYFITLTSSPASPPLESTWNALRVWLKRYRPGMCWIYCFTLEGHGVIHMVVRLPMRSKNINVKVLRAYWQKLTGATQIRIVRVRESNKEDLADYLVNQKLKKGLGQEFAHQSSITRWHWSKGWLPKGFTKEFGRLWVDWIDAPDYIREWAVGSALAAAHEAEKKGGDS